jgi:hypothetical protein
MEKEYQWSYAICHITSDGKETSGEEEHLQLRKEGYEPYAVTHWVEAKQNMLATSKPTPVMVEKHFFKKRVEVKIDDQPKQV